MDNDKCRKLIQLYASKELLWNAKNENYHNKNLREGAWQEISVLMYISVDLLKKKMTNLLASYRREKSRIKKSYVTGSGGDSIYVSKWFAFDDFSFMADKNIPNETSDTMSIDEATQGENTETQKPEEENSGKSTFSHADTEQATLANQDKEEIGTKRPSTSKSQPRRTKNQRNTLDSEPSPMVQEAFSILKSAANNTNDPYAIYGQHIGNELRKYDLRTLAHVKHAINNVIFEADMGKYSYSYSYVPPSSTYQGHSISEISSPAYTTSTTPTPTPSPAQTSVSNTGQDQNPQEFEQDENGLLSLLSSLTK